MTKQIIHSEQQLNFYPQKKTNLPRFSHHDIMNRSRQTTIRHGTAKAHQFPVRLRRRPLKQVSEAQGRNLIRVIAGQESSPAEN